MDGRALILGLAVCLLSNNPAGAGTADELMEIPPNDFLIAEDSSQLRSPDVAYNATNREYFVVFLRQFDVGGGETDREVFGQRINRLTGATIGDPVRISQMGSGQTSIFGPRVVWNAEENEYLVVWYSDSDTGSLVSGEFEIYGQRVDGATGAEVGTNDFRISQIGADGDDSQDAVEGFPIWNATDNEYLVVWSGNAGAVRRIFGQRLTSAGAETGSNDFGISGVAFLATDGDSGPTGAWNALANEYLIAWRSDALGGGEQEIFGQLLTNAGAATGPVGFRISDLGPEDDAGFSVDPGGVAWSDSANEYLVVFAGEDDTGGLVDGQFQIFGQRISAAGAEVGENDFRISDSSPAGDPLADFFVPDVTWNASTDEYLVAWEGEDITGPNLTGFPSEIFIEIYVQRLNADGTEPEQELLVSDANDPDPAVDASNPALAWNITENEYLTVWENFGADSSVRGQILGFAEREPASATNWRHYH